MRKHFYLTKFLVSTTIVVVLVAFNPIRDLEFVHLCYAQEPEQVKAELFREIQELFDQAAVEEIPILSPTNFARAQEIYQAASAQYKRGANLEDIKMQLYQAKTHLEMAFESARMVKSALEDLIPLREQAQGFGQEPNVIANKEAFQKAEDAFHRAVLHAENGNIGGAKSIGEEAKAGYREAILIYFREGSFKEAETWLEEVKVRITPERYQELAQNLAQAKELLKQAQSEGIATNEFLNLSVKTKDQINHIIIIASTELSQKEISSLQPKVDFITWEKGKLGKQLSIDEKYAQLGGPTGFLGSPKNGEQPAANGGKFRHYQGGSIYWHPSTGAYELHGAILAKWNEMGAEQGFMGYPLSDELKAQDGIGRYQMFQGGTILWTAKTGAHEMHGEILKKYKALGAYNSVLGYPKTDTYWSPNEKPLWKFSNLTLIIEWLGQDFLNPKNNLEGSIWWTQETGAHEVHGAIWKKWKQLGYDWNKGDPILGHPKTDELKTPNGIGRFNHFTESSIYWSPTTKAHFVRGVILKKWEALNWEKGILGYPTTDELITLDGSGKYNHFEHGSIYWSSNSGAHEVHGAIKDKWAQLGWEKSFLGFPHTDVLNTPNGKGQYANFYGGGIVWYANTGAQAHRWFEGLTVYLGESIYINPSVPEQIWIGGKAQSRDMDGDLLKDDLEGKLAEVLSPYYKFDSAEKARRSFEPITLFQVRPKGCTGTGCVGKTEIWIKWTFLFIWDGGYGPASACSDKHMGDNDKALYKLTSDNGGFTWKMTSIMLGDGPNGFEWPQGYPKPAYLGKRVLPVLETVNLQLYQQHHPVIYMSAHKHHLYFDTAYDGKDSFYSAWKCDEDVNGKGAAFLADLHSVFKNVRYNNVGEPKKHPKNYFVNCMTQFAATVLPGRVVDVGDLECNSKYYSAWGTKGFYQVGSNANIWLTDKVCKWWSK
ncbi:MAG: hypothetical protein ACE5JB_07780 [bacterium]